MSQRFLSFHAHLREIGLLGEKAVHFGGPDDVLLYSGGPQSHLAQYSMLCGPSRKRVLVRQPSQSKYFTCPTTQSIERRSPIGKRRNYRLLLKLKNGSMDVGIT